MDTAGASTVQRVAYQIASWSAPDRNWVARNVFAKGAFVTATAALVLSGLIYNLLSASYKVPLATVQLLTRRLPARFNFRNVVADHIQPFVRSIEAAFKAPWQLAFGHDLAEGLRTSYRFAFPRPAPEPLQIVRQELDKPAPAISFAKPITELTTVAATPPREESAQSSHREEKPPMPPPEEPKSSIKLSVQPEQENAVPEQDESMILLKNPILVPLPHRKEAAPQPSKTVASTPVKEELQLTVRNVLSQIPSTIIAAGLCYLVYRWVFSGEVKPDPVLSHVGDCLRNHSDQCLALGGKFVGDELINVCDLSSNTPFNITDLKNTCPGMLFGSSQNGNITSHFAKVPPGNSIYTWENCQAAVTKLCEETNGNTTSLENSISCGWTLETRDARPVDEIEIVGLCSKVPEGVIESSFANDNIFTLGFTKA